MWTGTTAAVGQNGGAAWTNSPNGGPKWEPPIMLIADRFWRTRSQLELAIVEYAAWFNTTRLHRARGDRPPAGVEALHAARIPALRDPQK